MVEGLPAPWATVDEVYGADPELRLRSPQQRGIGYVHGHRLQPHRDHRRGHRTG